MNLEKLKDTQAVTLHISKIDENIRPVIQYLREVILAADASVAEHIKWNNPCFYYSGEMAPFDPKEYKREIIVMNLHKNRIMLVWPSGAKLNEATGLLQGTYADGRRTTILENMTDAEAKTEALQNAIRAWVKMVE